MERLECKQSNNKSNREHKSRRRRSIKGQTRNNKHLHSLKGTQYMDECSHYLDNKGGEECGVKGIDYGCNYKHSLQHDTSTHHSPLCLAIMFILQYLPVFVAAILYEIHTSSGVTTPLTLQLGLNNTAEGTSRILNE